MSIVQSAVTPGARVRRVRFRELPLQPPNPDWHQLDDRLDRQHSARLILHALHDLDLRPLCAVYAGRGSPAYPPERLLAAVLDELHCGHRSPAQWFRHAQESDPLRWLLGGHTPCRTAWYDFRDRIAKENVYRPLYNVPLLDDLDSPLILAYGVFAQPNDAGLVGGLLRQAQEGCGPAVAVLVGDASYAGGPDLAAAAAPGTTVYAPWQQNDYRVKKAAKYYPKEAFVWSAAEQAYQCPAGQRLELRGVSRTQRSGPERIELQRYAAAPSRCQGCALRERCTGGKRARTISRSEHEEHSEALRARMATAEGQALYKQRKQTVELANADVKTHRGLRRFSGHGRRRATTELGLVVLREDLVALSQLRRQRHVGRPTAATPLPQTG